MLDHFDSEHFGRLPEEKQNEQYRDALSKIRDSSKKGPRLDFIDFQALKKATLQKEETQSKMECESAVRHAKFVQQNFRRHNLPRRAESMDDCQETLENADYVPGLTAAEYLATPTTVEYNKPQYLRCTHKQLRYLVSKPRHLRSMPIVFDFDRAGLNGANKVPRDKAYALAQMTTADQLEAQDNLTDWTVPPYPSKVRTFDIVSPRQKSLIALWYFWTSLWPTRIQACCGRVTTSVAFISTKTHLETHSVRKV